MKNIYKQIRAEVKFRLVFPIRHQTKLLFARIFYKHAQTEGVEKKHVKFGKKNTVFYQILLALQL